MVTGESHYVWGVRRRLKVVERPGRAHIEVDGDRLLLYVPAGHDDRAAPRAARPAGTASNCAQAIPDAHREVGAASSECRCPGGASGA